MRAQHITLSNERVDVVDVIAEHITLPSYTLRNDPRVLRLQEQRHGWRTGDCEPAPRCGWPHNAADFWQWMETLS